MRLDLADLRRANLARRDARGSEALAWSGGDWGNELAGETGEACNVVKKMRRLEVMPMGTWQEQHHDEYVAHLAHLIEELGDVVICADLLAIHYGIDLAYAVTAKFNATSEKWGMAEHTLEGSQ